MKVKLMVVSDMAVVDDQTNNVSLFNIFTKFTPEGFPFALPRITITGMFEKGSGDKKIDLTMRVKQGKNVLFKQEFSWEFTTAPGHRNIIQLFGLVVPKAEPLVFQFIRDKKQISKYTIDINAVAKSKPNLG